MFRTIALTGLTIMFVAAGSSSAIELKLEGNVENGLEIGLSQTGTFRVGVLLGSDDGEIADAGFRFDATPLRESRTDGYEVVGAEFLMTRNDGTRWESRAPQDFPVDMEFFVGLYGDSVGTQGDDQQRYFEEIIIHGLTPGIYDLYFENPTTDDDPQRGPNAPQLFDRNRVLKAYSGNRDLPGFVHFANAWIDPAFGFDVPFVVTVTPEPGSLLLLGLGGLAVFRRRQ